MVSEVRVSAAIRHVPIAAMCAVTLSNLICHHESVCNGGNDVGDHPQVIMDTKVIFLMTLISKTQVKTQMNLMPN